MTIPSDPNPDREEYVDVVNTPDVYQQQRVVRDTAAERYTTIARVNQVIWLLFGFLEALLGLRLVLKLIGANPGAVFTQVIYGITDVFLWPFAGIVPSPGVGAFQLEIPTIIAMLVYALAAWAITRLIWVLFYRPTTTTVSTYRQDRR